MAKTVYAIEGLDRLGKSTLIDGILNTLGYYQVIHFSKPTDLDIYRKASMGRPSVAARLYQEEGFRNSMMLARSGARIVFDRWHLGEMVYAPMYRGYDGDYVLDLERRFHLDTVYDIRLILLTEDFEIAKHFVDDGQSLGAIQNRQKEQQRFVDAFGKSIIRDKRIICVTDPGQGGFKRREWILNEALE